jgi:hypothetical protein
VGLFAISLNSIMIELRDVDVLFHCDRNCSFKCNLDELRLQEVTLVDNGKRTS